MYCFIVCLQSTALMCLTAIRAKLPLLQLCKGITSIHLPGNEHVAVSPYFCPVYLPPLMFVPHGDRVVKGNTAFQPISIHSGNSRKIMLVVFKHLTSQECLGQPTRQRKC